jgi:hypothetical protein
MFGFFLTVIQTVILLVEFYYFEINTSANYLYFITLLVSQCIIGMLIGSIVGLVTTSSIVIVSTVIGMTIIIQNIGNMIWPIVGNSNVFLKLISYTLPSTWPSLALSDLTVKEIHWNFTIFMALVVTFAWIAGLSIVLIILMRKKSNFRKK